MGKELSEMTLAELWELFPIFLVQHDDKWKNYYKEIEDLIMDLLPDYPVERISHIGSTAIQGIWAKNIVDVMVEISEKADMEELAHVMERNGFIGMSAETNRISLNKGYPKEGFADKVYHIHLRYIICVSFLEGLFSSFLKHLIPPKPVQYFTIIEIL